MQVFIYCKFTLNNTLKTNCNYFYTIASTCFLYFLFILYYSSSSNFYTLQYDLYQRLRLQFFVLLMMGAMDAQNT